MSGCLAALLSLPTARGFFGLGPLHLDDLLLCLIAALGLLSLLQLMKRFWRQDLLA